MTERLESGDLAAILDLVHALGDVEDPDAFLDVSLRGVMELVPCTVATMNEVVPSADRSWPGRGRTRSTFPTACRKSWPGWRATTR